MLFLLAVLLLLGMLVDAQNPQVMIASVRILAIMNLMMPMRTLRLLDLAIRLRIILF